MGKVGDVKLKFAKLDGETQMQFEKVAKILTKIMTRQNGMDKELESFKDLIDKRNNNVGNTFDHLLGSSGVGSGLSNGLYGTAMVSSNNGTAMLSNINGTQHKDDGITSGDVEQKLRKLENELEQLKAEMAVMKVSGGSEGENLEIGGFRFTGRDNLLLWATAHLPPVIPYGCFVDVYSLLNRMIDWRKCFT